MTDEDNTACTSAHQLRASLGHLRQDLCGRLRIAPEVRAEHQLKIQSHVSRAKKRRMALMIFGSDDELPQIQPNELLELEQLSRTDSGSTASTYWCCKLFQHPQQSRPNKRIKSIGGALQRWNFRYRNYSVGLKLWQCHAWRCL